MPKSILFYKFSERKPEHDQSIWFVEESKFYSTYEFRFGTVEYRWDCLDECGEYNGGSFYYNPGEDQPENTKLNIVVHGFVMSDDMLWCSEEEAYSSLFG